MDLAYCYSGTDILINKLNIRNSSKLREAERMLSSLRIHDLLEQPIKGDFDLKHLQKIHAYIFQDIYTWAGKIRTVDIAKGNMFCKVLFIEEQANDLFVKLKNEKYLRGIGKEDMIQKLAFYFF